MRNSGPDHAPIKSKSIQIQQDKPKSSNKTQKFGS
uniref:Uncharacterized protein n=1 Tax=Arundo donax TaxID=35708 RepID=A0A0A8ZKB7_ARUDO